jgi:hypothetical protein
MLRPDWPSDARYDPLRDADTATLAGEFLKRNPAYIADTERLAKLARAGELTLADREVFATAWGLRFRIGRRSVGLDSASATDRGRRRHDTAGAYRGASTG